MKELTLQEILDMPARELVNFFTGLDMEERLRFYNSLLDRHKDHFADQIDVVMGVRKFFDIAAEHGVGPDTPFEELEALAKEENDPAAQYYLSRIYLERWQKAHPYLEIPEDYENEEPSMEAMKNDWESARRWAIECSEQNFNEGLYAQALCYDRVTYPPYYTKKLIRDFNNRFSIIRYEAVVIEKYNESIACAAAVRLGELYQERGFEAVCELDEMRRELRDRFDYRCKAHTKEQTDESRLLAEQALDNLRYYDERRIAAANRMLQAHPEQAEALLTYRAFHQQLLNELQ